MANFNPAAETKADTKNPERGPLLIFTGEDDHAVPPAMSRAAFKKQKSHNPGVTEHIEMPHRGHSLTIDHGWREVGENALAFVKRFGDSTVHLRAGPRLAGARTRARSSAATRSTPSAKQGEGPLLLLLHGFPSSSYDWRLLLEELPGRNVLAFDFLGFGLSAKPREHDYSLFWQADLTEELVRRHGAGRPVFIVAHDMGTSVANELMARDLEGKLAMELAGIAALQRQHGAGSRQPDPGAEGAAQPLSARSSPGSPASASSATSSARSSPPRTRSATRRPPTSGR